MLLYGLILCPSLLKAQIRETIDYPYGRLQREIYGQGIPLLISNRGLGMNSEGFRSLAK